MKKNRTIIIKIVVYAVLILLCVLIYLKYGLKGNESAAVQTAPPTQAPSPTPQHRLFRSTFVDALIDASIPLERNSFDYSIESSCYEYSFIYGDDHYCEGIVRLTVDSDDCVVYAELELENLNYSSSIVDWDAWKLESLQRDNENLELIRCFVSVCTGYMKNCEVIPNTKLEATINKLHSHYSDNKELSLTEYGVHYQLICDESDVYLSYHLIVNPK